MKLLRLVRSQVGISLLEVLIAVFITGVITTAVMQVYVTQHKNYLIQDDITEIQQAARASIDEITKHVRMAGSNLPDGLEAIAASNTNPDTITLTYRNSDCDTYLATAMPIPSAELKCATDISCFHDDQWVYIFEPDSGGGEWFLITHVQDDALHLQHNTMVLSKKYGKDAIIVTMEQVKFYVDNTTDPNHPNLMIIIGGRPPQVFAENITDLQFQYRLKNGMIVDVPMLTDDVREVIMSVTGRSRNPDAEPTSDDPYRYRTYSSSVSVRNLGV